MRAIKGTKAKPERERNKRGHLVFPWTSARELHAPFLGQLPTHERERWARAKLTTLAIARTIINLSSLPLLVHIRHSLSTAGVQY